MSDLRALVLADRQASYRRLKGGFPIPLAGAIYWLVLAWIGWSYSLGTWLMAALWGSGLIFPLALGLAAIFRVSFLKDRTAVSSVLLPTFISMFLFWPMMVSAVWTAPKLAPLILAIGLSLHWPVIGWAYGRTVIFTAHAVIRALVVFYIWNWMPEARLTLLPLSVAAAYLATVLIILIDLALGAGRAAR